MSIHIGAQKDEIAENMIEFRIYWDMMLKLLRKYDII